MALIDDVVAYLEAQGFGVYGQTLFVGAIPDESDDVVGLYVLPDAPPAGRQVDEWISIDVAVRSHDYEVGEAKALALFNALVYPPAGFIVVEGRYAVARWTRIVNLEGQDENQRLVFGFGVSVERAVVDATNPDPWIDALATWLTGKLPAWQVYKHEWPRDFARPSILLRPDSDSFKPHNRLHIFRKLTVAGHVLGRAPREQDAAVGAIAAGLQQAIKIVGGRHHLTVENVTVKYDAEPFRQGQIRITFSGGLKVEELPVELMWHIYVRDGWR